MKKFLLFVFDTYYPHGGWSDFVGSYDSIGEAKEKLKECGGDWFHIVNGQTGGIVLSGRPQDFQ